MSLITRTIDNQWLRSACYFALLLSVNACQTHPPKKLLTPNNQILSQKLLSLKKQLVKQDQSLGFKRRTKLTGITSALIIKDDEIIFEEYFSKTTATKHHQLKSAGKSIISAVVGIAIDQHFLKPIDTPIYQYLPYQNYENWDERKAKLSLAHLMSMTAGWQCGHISQYRKHCGSSMFDHDDPYKWLLDRPMEATPGERFNYNDANPYFVSVLLSIGLMQDLRDFSQKYLFEPIGIKSNFFNHQGLTTREMGIFGQLYLNKGQWKGKQIISRDWIEQTIKPRYQFKKTGFADSYGYFWWNKEFEVAGKKYPSFFAAGNGGQYIVVFPEQSMVVVFTGTNFNRYGVMNQPMMLIRETILPAISGD